jgi:hypothetical protein
MSDTDPDDSKRRATLIQAANPVLACVQYGLLGPCVDFVLLFGVGVGHLFAAPFFVHVVKNLEQGPSAPDLEHKDANLSESHADCEKHHKRDLRRRHDRQSLENVKKCGGVGVGHYAALSVFNSEARSAA